MKTKLYFFLWVCLSTLLIACVDDDIEPDVVPVTGVSLNKTALALDEGESESLIAILLFRIMLQTKRLPGNLAILVWLR